jgi:hypothetical protein
MLAQDERRTGSYQVTTGAASPSPATRITRPNTVEAGLTPKRRRRQVENDEYSAFVRRILGIGVALGPPGGNARGAAAREFGTPAPPGRQWGHGW